MSDTIEADRRRGGRAPAGTDQNKRQQILEGAGRVFCAVGFDAASMGDIAREAEVSKATLYVYFPNKEKLFAAICAERRDRNIVELIAVLDQARPIGEVLKAFGTEALRRLSQPFVMAAHRIVIGVAERMPEVGREFFEAGPSRLAGALAAYLDSQTKSGSVSIDDPRLAAVQFLELIQATVYRPRLYNATTAVVSEQEIEKVVGSAVRLFLKAYSPT